MNQVEPLDVERSIILVFAKMDELSSGIVRFENGFGTFTRCTARSLFVRNTFGKSTDRRFIRISRVDIFGEQRTRGR